MPDPAKAALRAKKYRWLHREELNKRAREKRLLPGNRERDIAIQKKYRDSHPGRHRPQMVAKLERYLFNRAKYRSKLYNLPFNIELSDIVIPEYCPVLGIPIDRTFAGKTPGKRHAQTPSLDRIIPSLGYVKGNIIVISFRTNRLKQNASLQELRQITAFYNLLEQKRLVCL